MYYRFFSYKIAFFTLVGLLLWKRGDLSGDIRGMAAKIERIATAVMGEAKI